MKPRWVRLALFAAVCSPCQAGGADPLPPRRSEPLPDPIAMARAQRDVWGAAALAQPDGPSYEFFKDLLPPLRYVNTEFRHYPIVLSPPAASIKARWVSNGSGVNLRANKKPMWKETGSPVAFRVGLPSEPFGARRRAPRRSTLP